MADILEIRPTPPVLPVKRRTPDERRQDEKKPLPEKHPEPPDQEGEPSNIIDEYV